MRVLVNPAAAGGRVGRQWAALDRRLHAAGLSAPRLHTTAPGHAAELAERAVRDGAGTLVVVGGDGTVAEAANGMWRAGGGRLALLPLGTGNDAVRTLGVPLDLDGALRVALGGRPKPIDVIRIGEEIVLNAIGIGLTADISARAARVKLVRGIAAYLATALVSMVRYSTPEVRLSTTAGGFSGPITAIAVHNGPTSGGGFNLTPRARPDDGLLDVTLVPGIGLLGRPRRLIAAMRGTLGALAGTVELQSPWLELFCERALPVHLDGNPAVLAPPTSRFEIVPEALEVLVPAG